MELNTAHNIIMPYSAEEESCARNRVNVERRRSATTRGFCLHPSFLVYISACIYPFLRYIHMYFSTLAFFPFPQPTMSNVFLQSRPMAFRRDLVANHLSPLMFSHLKLNVCRDIRYAACLEKLVYSLYNVQKTCKQLYYKL